MPGRVMIPQTALRETRTTPEVYKLTFPGMGAEEPTSKSGFRGSFIVRRFQNGYRKVQPSKTSFDAPELESFSTATATSSEDHSSSIADASVFTASTRTSRTGTIISGDDSFLLTELSRSNADFTPARHSTACCTDLALRRELRKKFHVEPTVDEDDQRDNFAMGHSFRRELEKEVSVESLALWEETEQLPAAAPLSRGPAAPKVQNKAPHSWHAGDPAALSRLNTTYSSRNKGLESILRGPKKKSFFNGFFSGLSFSSSRKSRKSS